VVVWTDTVDWADGRTGGRAEEPPGDIWFEPAERTGDGTLRVHDTGIGLTDAQVHDLLATIGRSSKRDDLGFARHEFLGQFGIGLLSCFMVADEIRVVTRSGDRPTVLWTGHSDGPYAVTLPDEQRPEPGTTVTLVPRRGESTGSPNGPYWSWPRCTARCCRCPSGSPTPW
jgi:molecular chaperone HtpG